MGTKETGTPLPEGPHSAVPAADFHALRTGRLDAAGETWELTTRHLGELHLPSGELGCWGLGALDELPSVLLDPGDYPVVATYALEGVPAYLSLVVAEGEPAVAEVLRDDDGIPVGVPVDMAAVAFVDGEGLAAGMPQGDWYEDVVTGEDSWFDATAMNGPAQGAALLDLPRGGNVAFAQLLGDGWAPLVGTYDARGRLLAVHLVLDAPEETRWEGPGLAVDGLSGAFVRQHASAAAGDGPCVAELVDVFEAFFRRPVVDALPVEEDGDAVLVQWHTDNVDERPRLAARKRRTFTLSVVRQVFRASWEDGELVAEDDEPIQMSIELTWPSTPENRAIDDGNLWSMEAESLDAFWAEVRSLPAVRWAVRAGDPMRVTTSLGQV